MNFKDPEEAWQTIDNESKSKTKKPVDKKKWGNPLQEKYSELCSRYSKEYGRNDGSRECERLLDDMRAFERVFIIMKWEK